MSTVVVTGATGFIGSALVERLSRDGTTARALSRSGADPGLPGATGHAYDLAAPIAPGLLAGADVVVHAAWMLTGPPVEAARVNDAAAGRLAAACRTAGARAVFVSSFAAHDEALSSYGRSKLAAERRFDGPQDMVVRLGLVAGRGGMFARLGDALAAHRVVPLVGGSREVQLIGIDDAVDVLARACRSPTPGTFRLAQPEPLAMRDLYHALAEPLPRRPALVPVPERVALAAARAAERLGVALPVTSESVLGLRRMRVFATRDDIDALGIDVVAPREVVRRYAPAPAPPG